MNRLHISVIAALALAAGCSSSEPSGDPAMLGSLAYTVPSGWASKDYSTRQRAMFEWAPAGDGNEHKESVDVFSSERIALAKDGGGRIEKLLQTAQQKLPNGKFGAPQHFTTRYGFQGVRIEGEFTPIGQSSAYKRIHAVLTVDGSLLHVVYTAREADRENFELVVDSFRQSQGA